MNDDVLLKQIREIVNEEVKASETKLTQKIDEVDENLSKQIDEVKESVEIIQEVMIKHNGMLEERVKKVEEIINIP